MAISPAQAKYEEVTHLEQKFREVVLVVDRILGKGVREISVSAVPHALSARFQKTYEEAGWIVTIISGYHYYYKFSEARRGTPNLPSNTSRG